MNADRDIKINTNASQTLKSPTVFTEGFLSLVEDIELDDGFLCALWMSTEGSNIQLILISADIKKTL